MPVIGQSITVAIVIGERLQCLLDGEKKLWCMCDGYIADLIVIVLGIALRENVADPYDVADVELPRTSVAFHPARRDPVERSVRAVDTDL